MSHAEPLKGYPKKILFVASNGSWRGSSTIYCPNHRPTISPTPLRLRKLDLTNYRSINAYGNVKRMQEDLYDGRVVGSELRNPDFVKLGESFGINAHWVKTPKSLRATIERAFSITGPTLIEVPVGKNAVAMGVSQPMSVAPRKSIPEL